MHRRRKRIFLSVLAIVVVSAAATAVLMARPQDHFRKEPRVLGTPEKGTADETTQVKVIHPRRDSSFSISIQQLVTLEPYFQANLRARASGLVKFVQKDIGDPVRQGEVLIEIDEPDLVQEVAQKEAVIAQRLQEVEKARSDVETAAAMLDVARAMVEQRKTEVAEKVTTRDTRLKRFNRFKAMNKRDVVDAGVIDEEEGSYLAAVAAVAGAEMAVRKAEADVREKQASLDGVKAERLLKDALIEVARRDRDRSRAMLDYARVVAPFDGTVTHRTVGPGAFVQNATTGSSESLISVARTDIVTAVFHLPDYAAAYVSRGTSVEMLLDELPGVSIRGRVTRFTPSIRGSDRTMRVEVDLFNGSNDDYRKFAAKAVACAFVATPVEVLPALTTTASGQALWAPNQKGASDSLPLRPEVVSAHRRVRQLLPGMGGTARIRLEEFDSVYLVPSSAVFSQGGKPYILTVQDGKTKLESVKVQVNDGRLSKIAMVARPVGAKPGDREVLRELNGNEEIVASRQLEIGDGQPVRATVEDW
ncbi:MAG: efflux RND transporter periplasmic adaptor subunit [Gemmataceae bacterium]